MKNTLQALKITIIQFILLFSFSAFGQCNIDALVVEISACEGEVFDVSIDFEYANTSDQFTVTGNGNNYGTFNYGDLPINITSLEADCFTEYEFIVTDVNDNDCSEFVEWGLVCCEEQCILTDLILNTSECEDDDFILTIDFDYEWNTSATFDWEIVGVSEGTALFTDLPLNVTVFDEVNDLLGFVVSESGNQNCSLETSFENPCSSPTCFIGVVFVEVIDCIDNEFRVNIDFQYSNTSDQFMVVGNGINYGTYSYADLPIIIDGLDGNCSTEYEFVVIDVNDNDCSNFYELGTVCCGGLDCDLFDLVIETSECDEAEFEVTFDFEYTGTTNNFFDWEIPGYSSGFAEFSDLPFTITIQSTNVDVYDLIINENDNADCSIVGTIENPCFDGECNIYSIDFGPDPECIDGFIVSEWYIFGENTSEIGYDIFINDVFTTSLVYDGTGPYDIEIEAPDTYYFTMQACDVDNPDCCYIWELVNPCIEDQCEFLDLVIETSECDGGFFEVTFDFDYSGNVNSFFDWEIPGYNSGITNFNELPLTVLIENTNVNSFDLFINENDNSNCAIEGSFENPCFELEECFIGALNIEPSECDGNEFFVVIDFEYANTSENFFVNTNGENYGPFPYSSLPVTIQGLEGNCDSPYEFLVYDSVLNGTCESDANIGIVCCESEECALSEMVLVVTDCVDGVAVLTIDFDHVGATNDFFDWEIGQTGLSGTVLLENLPLTVDIQNSDLESLVVYVNINDNEDCELTGDILNPCYDPEDCFIGALNIETSECDGNEFFVVIDFEYANTSDQFIVNGNGNSYGTFSYADLPITIDGLESNCDLNYEFIVHDVNDNDCASAIGIGEVCCGSDCEMTTLDFGPNPICENGLIVTEWLIAGLNTSEVGFDIFINNEFETFVQYNDTDWYDFDIENPGTEFFTMKVCDNDNEGCCIDWELMNPCYDPEECFIGALNIEPSECDGNEFFVVIDFEYANTSENFFVNTNGENYGPFPYSSLPVTIHGLEGNCDSPYEFLVYDSVLNGTCESDANIGIVCCESEECALSEMVLVVTDCVDGVAVLIIDFDHVGATNDFFDWEIGQTGLSGTVLLENLPLTVDIQNSDLESLVVYVNINDNEDCELTGDILNPCYDPEDCFIGALNIETSECDGNEFFVVIDFEYANTSDQFIVNGNGNSYGTFSYADLPITIDGFESNCDLNYEFIVRDADDNDCASAIDLGEVCCGGDCEMTTLDFGPNPICENGLIVTEWLIAGLNTSEVGFDIFINNEFETFVQYNDTDWYDFDIENPGTEFFTMKVCDNDNEGCCIDWELMNPCYDPEECDLYDLNFDASQCDGNIFVIEVDFEYSGNTEESFVWEIPGVDSGTELFTNLPLHIEIENSTESQFTFFANEIENPDCAIVGSFGNPCYDADECIIDDVSAEVVLCEEDLFDVEINFEYANVSSTFSIVGNGVEYGIFEYSDLPVTLTGLSANCELEYEFIVRDNDIEGCIDFVEIGTICCEDFNQISGLESETIITGEIFNVTFDITNTTLKGCNIQVYVGGELYETLSENDSEFTIGPFECGVDDIIEIELVNSCSEAELILMFDLSDIECVTDVDSILDDIDLKWNMIQKSLTLEGHVPVSVNIQLVNAQGALVFAQNGVGLGWNKNLNDIPSGLYFVRIVDHDSKQKNGLIKKILIY